MFTPKLNKRDIPYVIKDEKLKLGDAVNKVRKGEAYLQHDNVRKEAIEIWTEPDKKGEKILTYETSILEETPWSLFVRVYADESFDCVYVTYETYGDQVEAKDINLLQNSVLSLQDKLTEHKEDLKCHISDSSVDGGSFV